MDGFDFDVGAILGGAAGTGLVAWLLIANRQAIANAVAWAVNKGRTMLKGMWHLLLIAADGDNVEALGHILDHAADLKGHLKKNEALIREETDANRKRISENYKTLDTRIDEEVKELNTRVSTLEGSTAENSKTIQSIIKTGKSA